MFKLRKRTVHVSLFIPDHVTDLLTPDQLLRAPPAVSF